MAVTVRIEPHSSSLDMHGSPNKSNTYSLSGRVFVTPSSSSWFPRRATRMLLQSLVLTFDGQTELVGIGYSGMRLCSISEELVKGPVGVCSEGQEDSDKPCGWEITFDLRIPGWLPATETFGNTYESPAGVHYSLYATAQLSPAEDATPFSSLCVPVFTRKMTVHAPRCEIIVNRFHIPPPNFSSGELYPLRSYSVASMTMNDKQADSRIPIELISKLEVIASTPERIPVEQSSFPIMLRMRAPDLSTGEASKFKVTDFSIKVDQVEKYQTSPNAYTSRFPVSPSHDQPPHTPLCNPHPMGPLYELGLINCLSEYTIEETFSLLPDGSKALYSITNPETVFARTDSNREKWYTIRTDVPFMHRQRLAEGEGWLGPRVIRPNSQNPYLTVKHVLQMTLTCCYDGEAGSQPASERLTFSLPLHFIRTSPPAGRPVVQTLSTTAYHPVQYTSLTLPGYSQLYDQNGDPRIDGRDQLPAYSPSADASVDDAAVPRKDSFQDVAADVGQPAVVIDATV